MLSDEAWIRVTRDIEWYVVKVTLEEELRRC
jgi:hypothetical protein